MTYPTRDLYFSAFLIAKGYALVETERRGSQITFFFDLGSPEEAKKAQWLWDSASGEVNAVRFASSIRRLKNLVHAPR